MRIIHLLPSRSMSGAENVAITIIKGLSEYKCIYVSPAGPISEIVKDAGVEYVPLREFSRNELKQVVNDLRPALIHAHDYRASILAGSLVGAPPVISHLHNNWPWASRVSGRTLAYIALLPRYKRIIAVSRAIVEEHAFRRLLAKRTVIVENGIDKGRLRDLSVTSEAEASDVLFVGRLTEQKDPLFFIEIVRLLRHEFPLIRAVMVGTGALEGECRKAIVRYGLEENIRLVGFVRNPYGYMARARMLILPSRWEGYGLVAYESLVLGTPVLCRPVGGLRSLLRDGEGVRFCKTLEEFVAAASHILRNEEEHARQRAAAFSFAENVPDRDEFLARIRSVYEQVIPR